ncbi:H-NS histone family protein [Frateuria aurantia]
MTVKLDGLSLRELEELIGAARGRLSSATKDHIDNTRSKIQAILADAGLTLEQVFQKNQKKSGRSTGPVPPKFANPADPTQTWSGRGKRPLWFSAALASGATESSLLIGGAADSKAAAPQKAATKKAIKK